MLVPSRVAVLVVDGIDALRQAQLTDEEASLLKEHLAEHAAQLVRAMPADESGCT